MEEEVLLLPRNDAGTAVTGVVIEVIGVAGVAGLKEDNDICTIPSTSIMIKHTTEHPGTLEELVLVAGTPPAQETQVWCLSPTPPPSPRSPVTEG